VSDDISHLKAWAQLTQGVTPEMGSEEGILRAVLRQDGRVREEAVKLPFEAEPASYARALERIADKVTPK
tara:strand:+ start:901 stop:1110 length:210 start_codon:yes stop_codon:yes gene_type:complete